MKYQSFKTSQEFRSWLQMNCLVTEGTWLRIYKKEVGTKSITYAEALDELLCFGWIDGQRQRLDADSWLLKITPRRTRSVWSKVNTEHAKRLIQSGQMTKAGLAAIETAKTDGRWQAAYDSPRNATPPEDFLEALARSRKARDFFATLNKTNVYAIVWRLQTARKPETRARRLKAILEMLARGEKFHA